MKKLVLLFSLIFLAVFTVTGCGTSNQHSAGNGDGTEKPQQDPEMLTPLKVEIRTHPEKPAPGDEVTIEALVTHGDEKVNDADEVIFEIWQEGSETREKIPGELKGNGIYAVKKRFDQAGVYHVISHVTARDQHNMPQVKLTVGNGEQHPHTDHAADQSGTGHGHHTGSGLSILFRGAEVFHVKKEAAFTAQVVKEGQPLSGAEVRFEYWRENDPKHVYAKAMETEAGVYTAKVTPAEKGTYHVVIHVKKEELHEHQETTVEVKE